VRSPKSDEVTPKHAIMTAAEVAAYLRVPLKSLYTWRYTHDGPPSARVGKYLRYRRTDVDEWLDAQARFNRADASSLRAGPKGR
jgi:excisionase family DNA binding protein